MTLPPRTTTREADDAPQAIANFASPSHPERLMRLLLVGSVVLPLLILAAASWITYRREVMEASTRLERTLGLLREHALKVFDTFELSSSYLDEMLADLPDEMIRENESLIHTRLKSSTEALPQLRDLWIVAADGKPLVSGTIFPMPRNLDLSDREYFTKAKEDPSRRVFISRVLQARAADTRFFSLSRRRASTDGEFRGVTIVSIAPEYFAEFYRSLPGPRESTIVLARSEDGSVLASFSDPRGGLRGDQVARIPQLARNGSDGEIKESSLDDTGLLVGFRELSHGTFVAGAISKAAVGQSWLRTMSSHLLFGVPATLAMIGLAYLALRRTRRAALAFAQLREEVSRREVTEQALRQAQKMEAIGQLTGGIAHDFNNLLTAILGNVDLALRRITGQDERVVRSLKAVRQASERAAILVQRLLAFSRQQPLEVKTVDVNRLVQNMSELLRHTIGENIAVETVLAGGLWKCVIDPNQLENALLNLCVNARDAMPSGGKLTIETANTDLDESYAAAQKEGIRPGQYVMVAVTDTGSGMAPNVQERAFDPFFTTKPSGVGTGLGLSMVYGFAKQSNGHIRIYSEVGHGTTVKMYFPRAATMSGAPTWSEPNTADQDAPRRENTETILLVEDDQQVNRFASDVLTDLGYRVRRAHSGPEALDIVRQEPAIDLLLTDVILPGGMNGREVAREALAIRPNLKVLYATGYTANAIIHQGRLDPDVELLNKPFTYDMLAQKVRHVLGTQRVSEQ